MLRLKESPRIVNTAAEIKTDIKARHCMNSAANTYINIEGRYAGFRLNAFTGLISTPASELSTSSNFHFPPYTVELHRRESFTPVGTISLKELLDQQQKYLSLCTL